MIKIIDAENTCFCCKKNTYEKIEMQYELQNALADKRSGYELSAGI